MTIFQIAKVNRLRSKAVKASELPEEVPEGWTKSSVDPMNLLAAFKSLNLKPGYVLRAYQGYGGGNGNGFIWAMPEDAPFPEPEDCPKDEDRFLSPPKPPEALDDLMQAVEGDGSPWSYLSASLFAREAVEFGASWHGCDWSTYTILGADPSTKKRRKKRKADLVAPSNSESEWTWFQSKPDQWEPFFDESNETRRVVFFASTSLGRQRIVRFTDSFFPGTLKCSTEEEEIAEGPGGFVF